MLTYPATSGQAWYFDASDSGWSTDNVELGWRVVGPVDRPRLQQAMDSLVARHPALRTTLSQRGDRVVQQIHAEGRMTIEDAGEADLVAAITAVTTAPFNVRGGKLARAALCRAGEHEHVLMLVVHHSMCDGWSWALLHRDLMELHQALVDDRSPALSAPAIHMGDYAAWEQRALDRDVGEYWRERLSSGHPRLGYGRDAGQEPAEVWTLMLPALSAETAGRLDAISKRCGTTVPRVLGAGVVAGLAAYCDNAITVAAVTANRGSHELVDVVGNLADQLPVRVDLADDLTFDDVVRRYSDGVAAAYEHFFPPEGLRRAMRENPQRSTGAIFDVEVNWLGRGAGDGASELEGRVLVPFDVDVPAEAIRVKHDQWVDRLPVLSFVHLPAADGGIDALLLVNVRAVAAADAERLGVRVCAVIEHVSRNPDVRLAELTDVCV